NELRGKRHEPATLEWARKITDKDIGVLEGKEKYNREAPEADVKKLDILKGHVKKGQFVTKLRKVFSKDEMGEDLEFVRARVGDKDDDIEYVSILPTSPPGALGGAGRDSTARRAEWPSGWRVCGDTRDRSAVPRPRRASCLQAPGWGGQEGAIAARAARPVPRVTSSVGRGARPGCPP